MQTRTAKIVGTSSHAAGRLLASRAWHFLVQVKIIWSGHVHYHDRLQECVQAFHISQAQHKRLRILHLGSSTWGHAQCCFPVGSYFVNCACTLCRPVCGTNAASQRSCTTLIVVLRTARSQDANHHSHPNMSMKHLKTCSKHMLDWMCRLAAQSIQRSRRWHKSSSRGAQQ